MGNQLTLEEPFEEDARFWLPEAPDNQVDGRLVYRPGALIEAKLNDTFLADITASRRRKALCGQLMSGAPFTLFGAIEDVLVVNSAGKRGRVYAASLIEGGYYAEEPVVTPEYAEVRFTHSEAWFGKARFNVDLQQRGYLVNRNDEDLTEMFRVDVLAASIELFVYEQSSAPSVGDIRVGHTTWVRVRPDAPQSLDWFEKHARRLRDLLTLLVGEPVSERVIRIRQPDEDWMQSLLVPGEKKTSQPRRDHVFLMAFPFHAVSDRFADVLENWFKLADKHPDALELLFATMRSSLPYPIGFLSIVQVLDGLLPRTPGAQNHIKDRICSTVARLPARLSAIVMGNEPVEEFADRVRKGRNYWTHYNPDKVADRMSLADAVMAASRLETLAVIALYLGLGIDGNEIAAMMERTHAFVPSRSAYSFRDFTDEGEVTNSPSDP